MKLPFRVRFLNFFRQIWMIPPLESWLARRTAGVKPDLGLAKWVPNPYQYPTSSFRTLRREGLVLNVDVSDYIGHYLYFGFADPSAAALFSLVKTDAHIIDVGANIGWTAMKMARLAVGGWVMAFEPDPLNFSRCSENLARNTLPNLKVFPVALGNSEGRVPMEIRTPSNRGGNRIAPNGDGISAVELTRLDEIIGRFPDDRIDLIKIDVEGYELHVLKGAMNTLRRLHPVLFVELDDNNLRDQGESAENLVKYLEQLGYALSDALSGTPIHAGQSFVNCHIDIIAR